MSLELQIKTVKELTNDIKAALETSFPYVWVKGELGSVKLHSSGHRYFVLKEDDYVINGICWRGTPLSIELEEGKIVECYAKVTVFAGRSSYQIIAREIREVSSKGDILLKLEELKKRLREEGIFDLKRQDQIKKYPQKIALLTSPTGAVLHDMLHRINDRFPSLHVLFFPISVQGADSKKSILEGLTKAELSGVDLVILARGGGSLEDLWIFNEEEVVRKVALLHLPIVTAIGHETDTTLVDYAANLRAPTPTAAIELCVPDSKELKKDILTSFSSSSLLVYEKLSNLNKIIDQFSESSSTFEGAIENFYQKLDNLNSNFSTLIKDRLKFIELSLVEFEMDFISPIIEKLTDDIQNLFIHSVEYIRIRTTQLHLSLLQEDAFLSEKEQEFQEKVIILSKDNHRITSASDITLLNKQEFSLNFIDGSVVVSEK